MNLFYTINAKDIFMHRVMSFRKYKRPLYFFTPINYFRPQHVLEIVYNEQCDKETDYHKMIYGGYNEYPVTSSYKIIEIEGEKQIIDMHYDKLLNLRNIYKEYIWVDDLKKIKKA